MFLMRSLNWIDYTVCVFYLMGISALGIYFYLKGQKTTKGYFLADRSMGWLPVGLALMASLTSGIGYLGQPAGSVKYLRKTKDKSSDASAHEPHARHRDNKRASG